MISIVDTRAMEDFGGRIADALTPGLLITLEGELGAGKTTLVRGVLRALGHSGPVKSPTYTLVETYATDQHPICHFDLYRLGHPAELEEMGLRDFLDGESVAMVEWPSRGAGVLPVADLAVTIEFDGSARLLGLNPHSEAGEKLARRLG